MTIADMKPTPAPAINRPSTMTAKPVEAVSRIHPTEKTKQPVMMVRRRPIKSATSPAMMAPKNVPAERIDVVKDWSRAVRWKAFLATSSPAAG